MPIDPTGTTPQPLIGEGVDNTINLKCKRCDSMTAMEVKIPGNSTASGRHMYRCTKCSATSTTNLGGSFEF